MFDKKKKHFWELAIVFGVMTLLALAISFGYSQNQSSGMMGTSMADMMGMHLQNVTVADLIKLQEPRDVQSSQDSMSTHHGDENGFLKATHQLTTGSIILLIPFIIAGTVFLAIVWLK